MNYYGSICVSDLMQLVKDNPSVVSQSKNGKTYLNIDVYVKEVEDAYGNLASISVKVGETRKYLGNLKKSKFNDVVNNKKAIEPNKGFDVDDVF